MSVAITATAVVGVGTALTLCIVHLAIKSSLLKEAVVYQETVGPFLAVYGNFVGCHSKAYRSDIPQKLANAGFGKENGFKGFGLYFDDPKSIKPEKCRSSFGSIALESSDLSLLEAKRLEIENQPGFKESGLKVAIFDESTAIMTKFTYHRNILILVAITKGYKALAKYWNSNNLDEKIKVTRDWQSSIELYDYKNRLHYIGFPTQSRKELLLFEYPKDQ